MANGGGELFESGLLGSSYFWWIGQIADDSVWKDNIISKPHATEAENVGWGRRYKVRILGLHDQGETEIPSKDLPWASVVYPVTAGGFLANSGTTPNLRGGNMVFGFFMDGSAMSVPIITGVLGNNSQNKPATTIGDNRVTNKQPGSLAVSGYATGQKEKDPKTGEKELPPDGDLKSEHPNSSAAAAQVAPGTTLNQFGLRPDIPLTQVPGALEAARDAREKARNDGLSFQEVEDAAMKAVSDLVNKNESQNTGPDVPLKASPQRESPDVQAISAGDVKEQDFAEEKVVMPIPDDPVGSAMKAIQTIIDNITQRMDKYLNAIQSYVDAVSSAPIDLEEMICKGAKQAAKYMKVLFDKIMEFVLKQLNIVMSKVVAALPNALHNQFGDLKEELNKMMLGLYNEMIGGLGDQLCAALKDALQPTQREDEARAIAYNQGASASNGGRGKFETTPKVPMCFAESIASTLISKNKKKMTEANDNVVKSLNKYIEDKQGELTGLSSTFAANRDIISGGLGDSFGDFGDSAAVVTNSMGGALDMIPDISSGLGAALDFQNVIANVFPGELMPKKAINDYYQLATGGAGADAGELPSVTSVADSVQTSGEARDQRITTPATQPEYVVPAKNQSDVSFDLDAGDLSKPMTEEEKNAALATY